MKQILCFGDSNTFGYIPHGSIRDSALEFAGMIRYPEDIRWTSRLAKRLKPFECHVIEEGLCGRTTIFEDPWCRGRCGMESLPDVLKRYTGVDLMILMLGTNDCKTVYNATAAQISEGMERLVNITQSYDPHIKILIISPIYIGHNIYREEYDPDFSKQSAITSRKLKDTFADIAQKNGCWFLAASDYANPSPVDLEHLTPKGHQALAEAIYEKLIEENFIQENVME